jgi:hypothetical protein
MCMSVGVVPFKYPALYALFLRVHQFVLLLYQHSCVHVCDED